MAVILHKTSINLIISTEGRDLFCSTGRSRYLPVLDTVLTQAQRQKNDCYD